ncbi:hypothetical protein Q5424_19940 [Conexibacter sp. JD483]|uniref:COG1470 family protein n=1 Tax=unclassified Conexibacter TaxID=2627773 RepID=UPI00271D7BA1|nr:MULTISPECIES: hypothetical protein [unclassified Conexibacter]MDO8188769.1 hypothetical protein [Conexibacter sp. CPCC 205706]MDO8201720.1 hypothetical protein [Conexibacter sp. CPCC 205762]MDR9371381.1 hypothetical protein [Conexibacter sp. JD483]
MPSSVRLALVAALCVGCLIPAGAQAAFVATGSDPAGDQPVPGRDLVGAGVGYDRRSGELVAAVALRGDPVAAPGFLSVLVARRTAGGCDGSPAAGFGSFTDEFDALWHRFASPTTVTAQGESGKRGGATARQQFTVTDRRLAGLRVDCAIVMLSEPGRPELVHDTIGPLPLRALPGLALGLGAPRRVRSGRGFTVKATVTNPGDAPTGRVVLRLAKARGMSAAPRTVTVRSIRPGGRATVSIRIRLSERADTATDLRVSARAGRLAVVGERTVLVRKPRRDPPSGGGGGGTGGSRTCVRWIPDYSGESGGSLGLVPC